MTPFDVVVTTMWLLKLLLFTCATSTVRASNKIEETTLYYYGLEESERGLPACVERQACSVVLRRYWRPAAVVRLCRCGRRHRCPATAEPDDRSIELNNRAHFKFCQAVTNWPQCSFGAASLTIVKSSQETYEQLDPDRLEELQHENIQLVPPKITFECRCNEPNYWKLNPTQSDKKKHNFKCYYLPTCNSEEFCGNFHYKLHSLYQSCQCPRHHICVHSGGIAYTNITELLYQGKGRKAYCRRVSEDDSNEDY